MADDVTTPEERDALAGELALGMLTGNDLARALRLQLSDRAFADEVAEWERRLAQLHDEWREIEPPGHVWNAIAARIGGQADERPSVSKLRVWRTAALVSGAIAASLALVLITGAPQSPIAPVPPVSAPQVPVAVAQMISEDGGPIVVARYDSASAELSVRATGFEGGALVPELWVIPADGKPRSLGLIARDGSSRLIVAAAHRPLIGEGVTLAITMEPATGAPHPAPSSAPVAAGKVSII